MGHQHPKSGIFDKIPPNKLSQPNQALDVVAAIRKKISTWYAAAWNADCPDRSCPGDIFTFSLKGSQDIKGVNIKLQTNISNTIYR